MSFRLLEQCRVSPPPSSSPRPALPLTMFDIPWLHFSAVVERPFFFPFQHSTSHFLNSTLPNLKSSLSLTLDLFYPLAGTCRRSSDGRFELHYSEGDSVSLTVSECLDADFHSMSGYHVRSMEKLLPLLPDLPISPDSQPLLAVQATLFPGEGLCLAFVLHHIACDGFSSTHFIKYWSAACSAGGGSSPLPAPPFLDRSIIADPRGIYRKISENGNGPPPPPRLGANSGMAIATFTLGSNRIKRLKHRAMEKAARDGKPSHHCSSFVVVSAYAWICHVRARGLQSDRVAHLFFPVDWRQRIRPRIPATYFGNCLGSVCFVEAMVGEITGKDGILIACEAIGKSIEGIGNDVNESMDGLFPKIMEALPKQPLIISGSAKLQVYDVDFGWGKPVKADVSSIRKMGAVYFAESRDDAGGVEVLVVLPLHQIDEFGKHFSNGL